MSRSLRKLRWLGAFVIGSLVYVWFFGMQTFFALQTRQIGRKIPIVNSVPAELEDLSVSREQGEKLSFQGAEFEVPWDDVDQEKTRIAGNWVVVHFRSGNSILLCVSPPDGFITNMSRDKTPDPELFERLYGPEVLRSDYALQKAIFETTPSQITLLTPVNRAAGLSSVIIVKAIMPPTTDGAIYKIKSKDFKGFQLGNPARRPKKMCLELYADDAHLEIVIEQNANGSSPGITQAELNRIIQTARKTVQAQAILTVKPA